MAKDKEEGAVPIYETRRERIVSVKDGETSTRIARFLKPCVRNVSEAVPIPNTPLFSEFFSYHNQDWPCKVTFKGYGASQEKWEEWIDRLAGKYGAIWVQSSICDTILNSRFEIRCNQALLLGLEEFWCTETNTFVFPFGEATITLEDVMINGGFSPVGESVRFHSSGEQVNIELALHEKQKIMNKSKQKKPAFSLWMQHFLEEENGDLEHAAFLSYWLSKYVFPTHPSDIVRKEVFGIAAHLHQGKVMALGPAVLASIYQNLRSLKEQAIAHVDSITITGPMQLLQLWAYERFPLLAPSPRPLVPGEPRTARWHKRNSKISLPRVREILKGGGNFLWCPYTVSLHNWHHHSYYQENEVVFNHSTSDEELQNFVKCMVASELEGINCRESYMPHRVAMQFRMDQDLPGNVSALDFTNKNISALITSRSFVPGVSIRYSNWWRQTTKIREAAIKHTLKQHRRCVGPTQEVSRSSIAKNSHYFTPQGRINSGVSIMNGTAQGKNDSLEKTKNSEIFQGVLKNEKDCNSSHSKFSVKTKTSTYRNVRPYVAPAQASRTAGRKRNACFYPDIPLSQRTSSHVAVKRTRPPKIEKHAPIRADFPSKTKKIKDQELSYDDLMKRVRSYSAAKNTRTPEGETRHASFRPNFHSNAEASLGEDLSDDDLPLSQRMKSSVAAKRTCSPEMKEDAIFQTVSAKTETIVLEDSSDEDEPLIMRSRKTMQ